MNDINYFKVTDFKAKRLDDNKIVKRGERNKFW